MAPDADARLSDVIETIYDGVSGGTGFDAFLAGGASLLDASLGAVFTWDGRAGADASAVLGYRPADVEAYRTRYAGRDIRLHLLGHAMEPDRVYADGVDFDPALIRASEVQQDFYGPLGGEACLGYRLFGDASRLGLLSFHLPVGRVIAPAQSRCFDLLARHLGRALRLQRQLATAGPAARQLPAMLELIQVATVLATADGRVVAANARAESLLARPESPVRLRHRRLEAVATQDDCRLRRAMAGSSARHGRDPPPSLLRFAGRDGVIAVMTAQVPRDMLGGTASDPEIIVFLTEPSRPSGPDPRLIACEFGLSPAEAEVAVDLYAGLQIHEISERRAVSRETVRTQVKRLMEKLDVHTQGQAIALVGRSLAALLPGSAPRS